MVQWAISKTMILLLVVGSLSYSCLTTHQTRAADNIDETLVRGNFDILTDLQHSS